MTTLDTRRTIAPIHQEQDSDRGFLLAITGILFAIIVAAALFTLAHTVPGGDNSALVTFDESTVPIVMP